MTDADVVIYSTLIVLTIVVAALSWWGIRLSRQTEAESGALTIDKLRAAAGSKLLPGPLLWGTWLGVNSIHDRRLILRDGAGSVVTEISYVAVPLAGVICSFEFEGTRYEYLGEGVVSGRMWLRDANTSDVVLSCQHAVRVRTIFRGKSDIEIARLHNPGLISEVGDLTLGYQKIGKLFYQRQCHARVLSLQRPSLSVLEQCFIMITAG